MKKLLCGIALASALSAPAFAASLDHYVGRQPEALLKSQPDFAKAYRSAIKGIELPAWSKRLAAGKLAEIVVIDTRRYILTSACSSRACLDGRLYVLFDPQTNLACGLFYLPPASDDPGDARTAFSRWYGLPADKAAAKAIAAFLLDRAASDTQTPADLPKN